MGPTLNYWLFAVTWITAKRQLVHDNTASRTTWNDTYDFIVVGAGAAGCVIANRLAANQRTTVLLIEAGGAPDAIYNDFLPLFTKLTDKRGDLEWQDYFEPETEIAQGLPDGRIYKANGKVLGGTSSLNWGVFNRGNPREYDDWAYVYGAQGWSYREMLPYFMRWENNTDPAFRNLPWHGKNGELQIKTPKNIDPRLLELKRVYNSVGVPDTDLNGPHQTGVMVGQNFIDGNGFRSSASNGFIDPNPYPNNLHILTKALARKIIFNGVKATGVKFIKGDIAYTVNARYEVIVTCGTVRTPQLLMFSGIGPRDHLMRFQIPVLLDLPVGNNYQNHPALAQAYPAAPAVSIENLWQAYYKKSGPLTEFPYILSWVAVGSRVGTDRPNICIGSYLDGNNKIAHYMWLGMSTNSGTVRLQSTSPHIQPLINVNFTGIDPQDYSDLIEGLKFMFYVSQQPSIVSEVTVPSLNGTVCPTCPGLKDYECDSGIKCYLKIYGFITHQAGGTCRMGDVRRDDVVVDPYCRVKNAQNLRVTDSSIFPHLMNSNPYSGTLMVAEKCSQIIKDTYNL